MDDFQQLDSIKLVYRWNSGSESNQHHQFKFKLMSATFDANSHWPWTAQPVLPCALTPSLSGSLYYVRASSEALRKRMYHHHNLTSATTCHFRLSQPPFLCLFHLLMWKKELAVDTPKRLSSPCHPPFFFLSFQLTVPHPSIEAWDQLCAKKWYPMFLCVFF